MEQWQIGTLALSPGRKAKGSLPIADRGDGSSIQLPLLGICGTRPGPTLVVSGGVHGDEYEGPRAIQLAWQQLDPEQMCGTFLGVPVVNVPAFAVGRRESPIDGFNLGRIFPGREEGFISEKIAYRFINQVCARASFYVDLHAGGDGYSMVPAVVYLESGPQALVAEELALARATGIELLWKGTGGWASPHVEAVRRGIPAVLAEIGEEGRLSRERLELALRVIRNVMIHAGMLAGTPELPRRWTVVAGTYMQSPAGGCFHAAAGAGESVSQGQRVGVIVDHWGDEIAAVSAPCDGIIVSTRTVPSIQPGERTTFVGRVLETLS